MRREWISLTKPKWEPNRDAGSFNFIHNMKGWRKGSGRGRGGGLRGAGDPPHWWRPDACGQPDRQRSRAWRRPVFRKKEGQNMWPSTAEATTLSQPSLTRKLDFSGNLPISPLSKWVMFRCIWTLFRISRGVVVAAEGFSPSTPFFRGRGQYDFRRRGLLHASPGGRQGQVRCAWKVFVFCGYWTSCSSCVN